MAETFISIRGVEFNVGDTVEYYGSVVFYGVSKHKPKHIGTIKAIGHNIVFIITTAGNVIDILPRDLIKLVDISTGK